RSKADALAVELGAEALPFEELAVVAAQFNVVISAVNAPAPILDVAIFANSEGFNQHFIIDLSMPRSIAADLENHPGIVVYTLDEIKSKTDETLLKRLEASKQVRAIVTQEIEGFGNWSRELSISPTIQKLKDA